MPIVVSAEALPIQGIPRFHEVTPHIYRGALPTPLGIQALANLGIVTVLDLRGRDEASQVEEHEVAALGMHYINIPMSGFAAPTKHQIERGLAVLENSQSWPVFVHCRYGVDRTGTLIACYRIHAEAWSNDLAKKEAEQMGMHRLEHGMKRFILQFPDR